MDTKMKPKPRQHEHIVAKYFLCQTIWLLLLLQANLSELGCGSVNTPSNTIYFDERPKQMNENDITQLEVTDSSITLTSKLDQTGEQKGPSGCGYNPKSISS